MPSLEFWFDFGSNYSYLSVMRIEAAAAQRGVAVQWRPFLLGPVFQSLGWRTAPFLQQELKLAYVWQDMVRECRKYGLPWQQPSVFPRKAVLALRVALWADEQPWVGEFCRRTMALNFGQDRDVESEASVRATLQAMGLDADSVIAHALSEPNKLRLRTQTETAMAKGIFGAPTFFAGQDMFWGNDRLDDALAHCQALEH
ncbi:2-hydroxychromene-2-carboxylate isomerase [Roseateles sp. BYS180W]|uniref:2-hydroxychromene-2-carboxylate isomerase n=1 Tax=Roseateles rivi TaxID=3299028 RepID=A0ABW7FSV2_9BURK